MKYLFIISPTSSGSTFLSKALSKCSQTLSLYDEEEYMREGDYFLEHYGPAGWSTKYTTPRLWTEHPEYFSNSLYYDWEKIKENWHKAWRRDKKYNKVTYPIFVEKSPSNLMKAHFITKFFPNTYFILLLRSPFALYESIKRHVEEETKSKLDPIRVSTHIIDCFKWQLSNMQSLPNKLYIKYESIIKTPEIIEMHIRNFLPELKDIKFNDIINGNENIKNISPYELAHTKYLFKKEQTLFKYFQYNLDEIC